MNRARYILAVCGIAGSQLIAQAGDCDVTHSGCTKCQQDDTGLLDLVDSLAGNLHRGMKKGADNFGKFARWHTLTKPKSGNCDVMFASAPSCGCEIKEPSCGVESKRPACDGYVVTADNPGIMESRTNPPNWESKQTPAVRTDRDDTPPSLRVPAPQSVPDTQVNPFLDEPRTGSRVRGRTIQYRQPNSRSKAAPVGTPAPRYGQQYHSQASQSTSPQPTASNPVRSASSVQPTLEETFQKAYRVVLSDSEEVSTRSSNHGGTGLRPVPALDLTRTNNNLQVSEDPFEREAPATLTAYPNPLRR